MYKVFSALLLSLLSLIGYSDLITTDTFQGPGIPTLDYGGARAYAKQNKTFVAFIKMRYGCAQNAINGLNSGAGRIRYAELGMPIVAGAINGFEWENWGKCPGFFSAVMDKYFTADGPYDFLIEDINDDEQTAVSHNGSGSLGVDKHGVAIGGLGGGAYKFVTGKKRTEFEDKYGVSIDDICVGPKFTLYNRDDTGYLCTRKDFAPYFSESRNQYYNYLVQRMWPYTSRPRKFKYRSADEGYAHGLIDSTGSSTGYNYLLHVATQKTQHKVAYIGPDKDRRVIVYTQYYYDNLQDWYKVSGFETNQYYSITTTDLIDHNSDGSVFVFLDENSAEYSTNAAACLNNCDYSARMSDAASGYTFKTKDKSTVMICFQLCNNGNIVYNNTEGPPEDLTEYNQVVQYKWFLKKSSAPAPEPTPPEPEPTPPEPVPVPEPEPQTPQYDTNVFEIAKLTDLVFEGSEGGYTGYETKITRRSPATGKLSIHMVWDKTERGLCQWENGETGIQTMEYTFPYDQAFNDDRRIDVSYENFFMKLLHSLVVRDRLVKYMAQEHYSNDTHNYDPSGLDLFPVTGMWFVDHDDILRCVDEPVSNSVVVADGPTLVMDLQTLKSGTVSIGSINGGKAEVFSANGFHQVVQTNFYPSASGSSKLYSRFIVKKSKRDFGSKKSETEIKPLETFKHKLDPSSVIRISFPSGSKLYEFDFVRD